MLKRIRRIVVRTVILSTIALTVILGLRFFSPPETEPVEEEILDETMVEVGDIVVTVSGTGLITPVRQVPLAFEVSAPVTEIFVESGQEVAEGDVIAVLDSNDFDAALTEAQIGLEFQQLNLEAQTAAPREVDVAAAEAALDAAQAAYNAAFATRPSEEELEIARLQSELARNQLWQAQLQAEGVDASTIELPGDIPPDIRDAIEDVLNGLNQQTREQAAPGLLQLEYGVEIADTSYQGLQQRGPDLGSLNQANAGRTQAQIAFDRLVNGPEASQIALGEIDLEQAELAVQQAQSALDRTRLVAPFDGVIAQNNLVVGQLPPTNNAAVLLIDDSEYIVDLPIDETDIVQVDLDQPVTLTFDALPGAEVSGRVTEVALTPTRIGELVTYRVRVTLSPTDEPIRVGMTTTARIATREVDDVLLLRNRFIRIDRATQGAFVTVQLEDGSFEEVPVEIGVRNDSVSQILSGLNEGQRVVLAPRTTSIIGGEN